MKDDPFLGKRNLYGPPEANTPGVWDLEDIGMMRYYDFITSDEADPFFSNNILLLKTNNVNGGQNNTLLDSSPNNRTLTRNGTPVQGAFNHLNEMFDGNWSIFFNGTSDYLTSTAPNLSGTWTVEFWWFPHGISTQQTMVSFNNGAQSGINIWCDSSGRLVVDDGTNAQTAFSTVTFKNNSWNHVAVVRNGTTTTGYINGAVAGTNTFTPSTTSTISIGRYNSSPFYYVAGYISNLRVVNGTAVYTAAFPVPTSRLTAITNTAFLSCQSNRQIDNSTNGYAISIGGGNPRIRPFVPFSISSPYNTVNHVGSLYLDGSGDYYNFTTFSRTGTFTCECWFYRDATDPTSYHIIFGGPNCNAAGLDNCQLYVTNTGGVALVFNATGVISATGTAVRRNQWNHIAWVRDSSGNVAIFVNGSRVAYQASSISTVYEARIDRVGTGGQLPPGYDARGFLSDVRITTSVVYDTAQTTYTVPTSRLTADGNTYLLSRFNNINIFDATGKNNIVAIGDAKANTSEFKFFPSAVDLDGTGDYLQLIDNPDHNLNSGNFTIEMWLNISAASFTDGLSILTKGWASGVSFAPFLIYTENVVLNKGIVFYASGSAGTSWDVADRQVILTNTPVSTWIHIAVTREGNTFRTYYNGAQANTWTSSSSLFNSTQPITIGASNSGTNNANINVQDLRITKGVARYNTASFSVPTRTFPTR